MLSAAGMFSIEQLVPLAVVGLAALLLMSSLRKRQRIRAQSPSPTSPVRSEPAAADEHTRLCRDLEALMVELQGLSRKISAQIDTRFAKLEAVIRDADRRIAVLTRLTRQAGADAPESTAGKAGTSDPGHAVVYELADAGFSAVDIARELGRTTGEVELILNLRARKSP